MPTVAFTGGAPQIISVLPVAFAFSGGLAYQIGVKGGGTGGQKRQHGGKKAAGSRIRHHKSVVTPTFLSEYLTCQRRAQGIGLHKAYSVLTAFNCQQTVLHQIAAFVIPRQMKPISRFGSDVRHYARLGYAGRTGGEYESRR